MFIKKRNSYSLYRPGNTRRLKTRKFIKSLILVLIIYEIITSLLLNTVKIESGGMNPSMAENDHVIVLPVYYSSRIFNTIKIPGIRNPERGDIVAYIPTNVKKLPWYLKVPDSLYRFFTLQKKTISDHTDYQDYSSVKRIIALPGDTVSVKNNVMYIKEPRSTEYKSEFELSNSEYNINFSNQIENWSVKQNPFSGLFNERILKKGEYFIIGDNRNLTSDSRNISPADDKDIRGKIIFRYWPLKRIRAF